MTKGDKEVFALMIFAVFLAAVALFISISDEYKFKRQIEEKDKIIKEKDKKIEEKDKKIEEKEETIETQVRMLIRLRDNCTCEWLYDFYIEHAEEVGAYE